MTQVGKSKSKWIVAMVIAVIAVIFIWRWLLPKTATASLDNFAQCLASKNVTMYGAYWCSHCQNQKAIFGDSFKYVPYVECTQDTQKCVAAQINGYPTWIFPAPPADGPDGRRFEGEIPLQQLSKESGCQLPAGYSP